MTENDIKTKEIAELLHKRKAVKKQLTRAEEREVYPFYQSLKPVDPNKEYLSNLLVEFHRPLVEYTLNRYFSDVEYIREDMIQEGMLGLSKVLEDYDYTQNTKFSTYAVYWIRAAMTRYYRNESQTIRVPVHLYGDLKKFKNMISEYNAMHQGYPSYAEISEALQMPIDKVKKLAEASKVSSLASFDKALPFSDKNQHTATLYDVVEDKKTDIEADIDKQDMKEILVSIANECLLQRDLDILFRRWGIDGQEMTLQELADKYHITKERIRQIEITAFGKLRRYVRGKNPERGLAEYICR